MQFFADKSDEDNLSKGFSWIPGQVLKFQSNAKLQVPHIGYNSVVPKFEHDIFLNLSRNSDFYFIHSYFFSPKNNEHSFAHTNYGENFSSIILKENIIGVQFHPEKSQQNGLIFLKNFYTFSKKLIYG